jgi:hypothetical protein
MNELQGVCFILSIEILTFGLQKIEMILEDKATSKFKVTKR